LCHPSLGTKTDATTRVEPTQKAKAKMSQKCSIPPKTDEIFEETKMQWTKTSQCLQVLFEGVQQKEVLVVSNSMHMIF